MSKQVSNWQREKKGAQGGWKDEEAASNLRNPSTQVRKVGPSQWLTPAPAPDFITPVPIQLPTPDYSAQGQLNSLCAAPSSHPALGDVKLREKTPAQVGGDSG